jgi:hypothetical protein
LLKHFNDLANGVVVVIVDVVAVAALVIVSVGLFVL